MGNYLSAPITAKRTEWGTSASGLPYAISCMQGWRTTMEDTHVAVPSLLHHSHDVSLFACFDGHGGKFAANFARNKFLSVLRETEEFMKFEKLDYEERDVRDKGIELLRLALHECFLALDAKLLFDGTTQATCTVGRDVSGCTALAIIVTPKFILCANAGDSRAVLTKVDNDGFLDRLDKKAPQDKTSEKDVSEEGNKGTSAENSSKEPKYLAIPLSHDHRPTSQSEKERIQKAGGHIVRNRIAGDLAVSRGLGDFRYKKNLSPSEQIVTCIPEISIHKRSNDADQFVVMGCDGIWDVHAKKDIIGQIVVDLSMDGKDVAYACEEILDLCLKKGSKDNMTAMLLVLPGLKYSPTVHKESVNDVVSSEVSATIMSAEEYDDDIVDNVSVNLEVENGDDDKELQLNGLNGVANDEDVVPKENGISIKESEKKEKIDEEVEMVQGEL